MSCWRIPAGDTIVDKFSSVVSLHRSSITLSSLSDVFERLSDCFLPFVFESFAVRVPRVDVDDIEAEYDSLISFVSYILSERLNLPNSAAQFCRVAWDLYLLSLICRRVDGLSFP